MEYKDEQIIAYLMSLERWFEAVCCSISQHKSMREVLILAVLSFPIRSITPLALRSSFSAWPTGHFHPILLIFSYPRHVSYLSPEFLSLLPPLHQSHSLLWYLLSSSVASSFTFPSDRSLSQFSRIVMSANLMKLAPEKRNATLAPTFPLEYACSYLFESMSKERREK